LIANNTSFDVNQSVREQLFSEVAKIKASGNEAAKQIDARDPIALEAEARLAEIGRKEPVEQPDAFQSAATQFYQKSGATSYVLDFTRAAYQQNKAFLLERWKSNPLSNDDELRWRKKDMESNFMLHLLVLAKMANRDSANRDALLEEAFEVIQLRSSGLA